MTTNGKSKNNNSAENKPSSAEEVSRRRRQGDLVTCLSGFTYRIRHIGPDVLIALGNLPDVLLGTLSHRIMKGAKDLQIGTVETLNQMQELTHYLNTLCRLCVIEPKVVEGDESGEGEITVNDIPFDDKIVFLLYTMTPVYMLDNFRQQQTRNVEALRDVQIDDAAPVSADEPEPVGSGKVSG